MHHRCACLVHIMLAVTWRSTYTTLYLVALYLELPDCTALHCHTEGQPGALR